MTQGFHCPLCSWQASTGTAFPLRLECCVEFARTPHSSQVIKRELCRWAVGVLVYEMVAGYPPFYDEDRVAMFRNICQVKYTVPSHFSKVCCHSPPRICLATKSHV